MLTHVCGNTVQDGFEIYELPVQPKPIEVPEPPKTFRTSKSDLAKRFKLSYLAAQGLVEFLIAQGKAIKVGSRKGITGKGKPTDIFEIPCDVTLKLAA